jgi:iron(III) transport system permease protein
MAEAPIPSYPSLSASERWWGAGALALSLLVALPILAIGVLALTPADNIWPHLLKTVLPGYVRRTLLLMGGVGLLTFVLGAGTAWLVTMCRFPGRSWLQLALLLPLATPTYIIAYTYVDLLDYSGPVQSTLRAAFGLRSAADYSFPDIRSLWGAVLVMSFVLYPYVFLTARASFVRQSVSQLEVARTLGAGPWRLFLRVALPLARPALAVGVSLAMMECLNDIGAVEFFGVNTLTVGIYSTWLGRGSLAGAAQIAAVMLLFVAALLWLERRGRRGEPFPGALERERQPARLPLAGWRAWAATTCCLAPVVLGFALPCAVLLSHALNHFAEAASAAFLRAALNSLLLAALAAVLAVAIGLFLAYAHRVARSGFVHAAVRFAAIGYAVPGTVLGIGILVPLAGLDNALDAALRQHLGVSTGLVLSGSLFAIAFGYVVRFLAISHGAIDAGLQRVTPNLAAAARTLGRSTWGALRDVHLPLIRPALGTAAILVFVDGMKELPATLILRPFDFETLATHVYALVALDLLEESALASLTIVGVGILPVILLSQTLRGPARPRAQARPAPAEAGVEHGAE